MVSSPGAAHDDRPVNLKATGWLLVVTLAVAAFVYFYEIGGEPGRIAAKAAEGRVFSDVAADAIDALWIKRPGEPEIRAERTESGWRLVAPIEAPGDTPSFRAIVRALAEMPSAGRIEDPAAPDVYGLGDDAILLSFTVGSRSLGLRIGAETPLDANVYVSVLGSEQAGIHMAPSVQVAALGQGALDLRDRRVLDFEPENIQRIQIASATLVATLERGATGWEIVAPARLAGDTPTVDRLLSDLSHLRADSFVDEPAEDVARALEDADYRVALSGDGVEQDLRLAPDSTSDETRLARGREGRTYRVRDNLVAHLPSGLFEVRDKNLLRFDAAAATSLTLRFASGEAVAVERASVEAAWADAEGRVATERVEELLAAIADLDAVGIVAESLGPDEQRALGLEPAVLAIEVRHDSELLAELRIGREDDEGVLAKAAAADAVYRLTSGFGERLPENVADFVEHFLQELPQD